MASHARSVMTEVLAALRASHAHYDLSTSNSTPKVIVAGGGLTTGIAPAYVIVAAPSFETNNEAALNEYGLRAVMEWWGFVAATTDTPEERSLSACDLADDVVTAIENAHHTSTNATLYALTTLTVSVDDVVGDGDDIPPGFGLCHGRITYTTTISRGV